MELFRYAWEALGFFFFIGAVWLWYGQKGKRRHLLTGEQPPNNVDG